MQRGNYYGAIDQAPSTKIQVVFDGKGGVKGSLMDQKGAHVALTGKCSGGLFVADGRTKQDGGVLRVEVRGACTSGAPAEIKGEVTGVFEKLPRQHRRPGLGAPMAAFDTAWTARRLTAEASASHAPVRQPAGGALLLPLALLGVASGGAALIWQALRGGK